MGITRRDFLSTTGGISISSFIPFNSFFTRSSATTKSNCRTGLKSIDGFLEKDNIEKILVIAESNELLDTFEQNVRDNSNEKDYEIIRVSDPSLEEIKRIIDLGSEKTYFITAISPVYSNLLYFSGDLTISITDTGKIIACEDEQPVYNVADVVVEDNSFKEIENER